GREAGLQRALVPDAVGEAADHGRLSAGGAGGDDSRGVVAEAEPAEAVVVEAAVAVLDVGGQAAVVTRSDRAAVEVLLDDAAERLEEALAEDVLAFERLNVVGEGRLVLEAVEVAQGCG